MQALASCKFDMQDKGVHVCIEFDKVAKNFKTKSSGYGFPCNLLTRRRCQSAAVKSITAPSSAFQVMVAVQDG